MRLIQSPVSETDSNSKLLFAKNVRVCLSYNSIGVQSQLCDTSLNAFPEKPMENRKMIAFAFIRRIRHKSIELVHEILRVTVHNITHYYPVEIRRQRLRRSQQQRQVAGRSSSSHQQHHHLRHVRRYNADVYTSHQS